MATASAPAGAQDFHVPPGGPYLLSHSVGCLPRRARQRIEEGVLEPWANLGSDAWPRWLDAVGQFRQAVGEILGAGPEQICPQPNLSAGLFSILASLPPDPQRRHLVASAHAFPSMGFAMGALSRLGLELRLIDEDQDFADPQVFADAMGADVRAVLITHVHSNTGRASPVGDLCAIARQAQVISIVDVAQSAGVMPMAPCADADVVLGSSVKWLCGGPGAAFLRVAPHLTSQAQPINVGWFSHAEPFAFDIRDFRYADDALRFWGGTPSIMPYVAALEGLRLMAQSGQSHVLEHNRAMMRIAAETAGMDLDMQGMGATWCCRPGERIEAVVRSLAERGCRFDRRGDAIRLSFHLYNDEGEAEQVGEALRG